MRVLAPIIRHLIAPAWAAWEGSHYLRHCRRLKKAEFDAPEVVQARQWEAVKRMLQHAYELSPFWRDRLDAIGLKPADIQSPDDYLQLPVLTKANLRTDGDRILAHGFERNRLYRKRTSGSTGIAVEVWVDDAALQHQRASTLRCDQWSGWRQGERIAQLWGDPSSLHQGWRGWLRGRLLDRTTYLDTLKIDEQKLAKFAESLRRAPPALLLGHAHSLYLLAKFFRGHGLPKWRPRGIISAAMVLHDWERREIEAVFRCPVTNRYGCEEVSLIACQCERHRGLHINTDGVYLELIRPDGSAAAPGEGGAVVVTDLTNRAMPILRYQIGDVAVLDENTCDCGRGMPILARVEGRIADYVVTPNGQLVSGISLSDHFATLVPGVAQLQIVQERVDHFVFHIVADENYTAESRQMIAGLVLERFGSGVEFECRLVDHIAQEASGKYRFCISKVANPYSNLGARQSMDVGNPDELSV